MKVRILEQSEKVEYVNEARTVFNFFGMKIKQINKYNVLYSGILTPITLPYTEENATLPYNTWVQFSANPYQKIQLVSANSNYTAVFLTGNSGDDPTFIDQGDLIDFYPYTYGLTNPNQWTAPTAAGMISLAFSPDGIFWIKNKVTLNVSVSLTVRYFNE